jgi:hypothetical protein
MAESHAFILITLQIDPTAGSVASGSSNRPELRLTITYQINQTFDLTI